MRHHAYERTRACCTYSLQTACTETHAFVQGVPGNVLHELADVQRVQRFAIFVRNTCIFAKRFVHTIGSFPRAGEVFEMPGFDCSPMPRISANKLNSHHARQLQIELSHAATRDASRNFVQHLLEHAETKHSTKQQRKRRIHITLARAIRLIRLLGSSNKKIQTANQGAAAATAAPAVFQKSNELMETARTTTVQLRSQRKRSSEATWSPRSRASKSSLARLQFPSARRQQNSTTRFSSTHTRCSRLLQTTQRMRIETQLHLCEPYDGEGRG